ncbi:MAG: diaminopimelate epimerase, partial [Rikenellaceae bacterium]
MKLEFYKYEGAGNDFVLIDNRSGCLSLTPNEVEMLCHRNLGIGGDGLMLIEQLDGYDFYMRYYNSDGSEVGMCGNGGRCIALFAHHLGIGGKIKQFRAKDGDHTAEIIRSDDRMGIISVRL